VAIFEFECCSGMAGIETMKGLHTDTKKHLRPLIAGFFVVLIGIGAWVVFHNTIRYDIFPKRFVELEEGRLFRSGQLSRKLVRDVFLEHDIGVVVDLAEYEPKWAEDKREEERVAKELGIEYSRFPLGGDGTGDIQNYARAIAETERARKRGKPVLVHCAAGARRTAGVIAAYQVLVRQVPVEVAYGEIERYGRSPGRSRIVAYLNANMSVLARLLVEMDVIDQVPDPMPQFARGEEP
jgi:protein tyrosine phosphatase (PTP) superfamily phosphohydrolase (DUF442 family)